MTNQERIQKIYMFINAVKAARRTDAIFMRDVTKEIDGTEDYSRAAEYFNELFGEDADFMDICTWDMNSVIALS